MCKNNRLSVLYVEPIFTFISVLLCLASSLAIAEAKDKTAEESYTSFCQSCHGEGLAGGLGPSLIDTKWLHGGSVSEVFKVIKNGVAKTSMPAWSKTLSDGQIYGLVALIRERAVASKDEKMADSQLNPSAVYSGAGYDFTLKPFAKVDGELWSMTFLPDGKALATLKSGELWLFEGDKKTQITEGLPSAMAEGQGGFFDVEIGPNYSNNKFVYLAYSEYSSKGSMTRLDKGRLQKTKKGVKWVHSKTLFSAPKSFHIQSKHHFGGRIVFKDNSIFLSIGDRGKRPQAQDLSVPNGKIHRLSMNGKPEKSNPFIKASKAYSSIWSYGHRNPQGLAVHPVTGDLWAAEHGPRGGDEINLIAKGSNYGWPIITYGMNYSGTPITNRTQQQGMEQPKHYWVPSIAVSGVEFYTGAHFPKWTNHLLVASLGKEELHLLKIEGDQVISDELVLKGLGRMRHVGNTPDGHPYIIVQSKDKKSSGVYRLIQAKGLE